MADLPGYDAWLERPYTEPGREDQDCLCVYDLYLDIDGNVIRELVVEHHLCPVHHDDVELEANYEEERKARQYDDERSERGNW